MRATYRVQLHEGFTFDDAAALAPHLRDLGVSHLYCSPVLEAGAGSTHGYDVVDPTRIRDALGGRAGFERLVAALRAHDLGLVLDIVPNHMALGGAANRWWWDVLEDGPASRWARVFDVDWRPAPGDRGPTVLLPVLGDHYGRILEGGGIGLARRGAHVVVTYGEGTHEAPIALTTLGGVLAAAATALDPGDGSVLALDALVRRIDVLAGIDEPDRRHAEREACRATLASILEERPAAAGAVDAALATVAADPDDLDALLARQVYRLAHWRSATETLDHRRFFDVTDLVGVRVEDPAVFTETHALVLDLVRRGEVDALRVDHVDGLRDPAGYLDRLAAEARVPVLVEKILARGERLPASWPVAGTTGYEFLAAVDDVLVDPDGWATLEKAAGGDDFEDLIHDTRMRVTDVELAVEVERSAHLLAAVCRRRRRHRDHTAGELRFALRAVLAGFGVYRTYVVPGTEPTPEDRARVADAVDDARRRHPEIDAELLDLLGELLVLEHGDPDAVELAVRFQQLSGPVMAKGVEDTAFYRAVALLSRCEVGNHPGPLGTVDDLHRLNEHTARHRPASMLTLSTHDTKRSADVRARLHVLSEIAEAWLDTLAGWQHEHSHRWGDVEPDPLAEQILFQSAVGAWPVGADRLWPVLLKSVREAKVRTSWRENDERYEAGLERWLHGVLADDRFRAELAGFLDRHRLVERGRRNSLAQVTLLLTSPGVPDLYQGTEGWDLSLVDPDNRRPVDHQAVAGDPDHAAKLDLVRALLDHRRRRPRPYHHDGYEALPSADRVVAFRRGELVTAVGRWGADATAFERPPGRWHEVVAAPGLVVLEEG